MTRGKSHRFPYYGLGLICLFTNACAMSHMKAGQEYVKRGHLSLAVEYFDQGLQQEPDNLELRNAFVLAEQAYHWILRNEIDRLKESKAYLAAIKKLKIFYERSTRMAQLRLPGDEPQSLVKEQLDVTKLARTKLIRDLDERANRAVVLPSDLRTCRQLQVFQTDDISLARRCERLLNRLKLFALLQTSGEGRSLEQPIAQLISKEIRAKNPELVELLSQDSETRNAVFHVRVEQPRYEERPWVLTDRDTYWKWIPKRDSKGRLVKRTVTIKPTQEELDKAKKAKKPAPKSKVVQKQVYRQVRGEYLRYETSRRIRVSYSIRIEDQRTNTIVYEVEGVADSADSAHYYDYRGDAAAVKESRRSQTGRHTAKALETREQLSGRAVSQLVGRVSSSVLERME